MKKSAALVVGAALVLMLGACGSGGSNTITTAPPAAAPAATTEAAKLTANWGETITLKDGLAITASLALRTPSQYASGAVDGKILVMTVSAKNTTAATINASLEAWPKVTYSGQGVTAKRASDPDLPFSTIGELLPGETQTVTHEFGIPTAGLTDVRAEFGMGVPAVFRGPAVG